MNNLTWTVDTLGHFCWDGKQIDPTVHKLRAKICGSQWMQKVLMFLTNVRRYHMSVLTELSQSLTMFHGFLSKPTKFYDNIQIAEKHYRENLDIKHQFLIT